MFVLLLIITTYLIPTYEVRVTATPVIAFTNLKDCEDERIRLTKEFDASYPPEERDYTFECKEGRKYDQRKDMGKTL